VRSRKSCTAAVGDALDSSGASATRYRRGRGIEPTKRVFVMLASAAVALTGTLTGMAGASATVAHASTAAARQVQGPHIPAGLHAVPACVNIKPGEAHCLALYLANPDGTAYTTPEPSGYGPPEFQDAY